MLNTQVRKMSRNYSKVRIHIPLLILLNLLFELIGFFICWVLLRDNLLPKTVIISIILDTIKFCIDIAMSIILCIEIETLIPIKSTIIKVSSIAIWIGDLASIYSVISCILEMFKEGFGSDTWGLKMLTITIVVLYFLIKITLFTGLFVSFILYINKIKENIHETQIYQIEPEMNKISPNYKIVPFYFQYQY